MEREAKDERNWQELEHKRRAGNDGGTSGDGGDYDDHGDALVAAAALASQAEAHLHAGALKAAVQSYAKAVQTLLPHLAGEGVSGRIEIH